MALVKNPIEELLSTPIPDEVWHYTTLEGLEGILSSGTIWATDARYTNDKTEFTHARGIVKAYLEERAEHGSREGFPTEDLSKMLDEAFEEGALSPLETEVYVASFSANGDLLSQWVQYADNCRGVALAFDLRGLRPPKELGVGITLAPCVYLENAKVDLIGTALSHFTEVSTELFRKSADKNWILEQKRNWNILQRVSGLGSDREGFRKKLGEDLRKELYQVWAVTLFDLLRVASHCKDQAFSAEMEWRMALPRTKSKPMTHFRILYRGPTGKIPYLAFNFFRDDNRLPITRVRTGPLCESTDEVRRILNAHGYTVSIASSSIPLRDPEKIS